MGYEVMRVKHVGVFHGGENPYTSRSIVSL